MSTQGLNENAGEDPAVRQWGYDILVNLNLVFSSCSLAGSLVMIVPFCLSRQLRKVRHRLILGLAVNDFVQAATVLSPSIFTKAGGRLSPGSKGCDIDAFFYLSLVVAGCLWALAIAGSTYITLVHPLSRIACWLHRSWAMPAIWGLIWLVSFINAAIGTALFPTIDAGGFCFFSGSPPHYFGNLVLFVPRTSVFVVVIALYSKLYLFFRKQSSRARATESGSLGSVMAADLGESYHRKLPLPLPITLPDIEDIRYDPSPNVESASSDETQVNSGSWSHGKLARLYQDKKWRKTSKDSQDTLMDQVAYRLTDYSDTGAHQHKRPSMPSKELSIPEGVEDGADSAKVPSMSPRVESSEVILSDPDGFQRQLQKMDSTRSALKLTETLTTTSISTSTATATATASIASSAPGKAVPEPGQKPLGRRISFETPEYRSKRTDMALTPDTSGYRFPPLSSGSAFSPSGPFSPSPAVYSPGVSPTALKFPSDALLPPVSETVESRHISTPPIGSLDRRQYEPVTGLDRSDSIDAAPHKQANSLILGLEEALAAVGPDADQERRMSLHPDEPFDPRQRRMSAAEENKRVSYLMMLYPVAYSLIVAVSIAMTMSSLITRSPAIPVLSMINRAFVLSMGAVDAIIYTIIEWRFRAATRAVSR